ncbi:P-loop containing nucleoside triphosphate hydrolase protein [Thamnocephalis sphaerospora]|uniref:P-loop containing nucleoside triphosphate hydrolase protein n=1 Tax=Thamnocephalis sphaerospora TaxID=78915 RepID=A0A4P9XSQ5_9FUNG|nr:P-loop containing nucleoside triphosphate hydrolase protein [Thamnocephalis sphaerospora]|eukprot:RKP08430.1 P-loop containing nucleoside triphosphate hydrolase protein [Thamnocephalis sphaerospora]
MLVTRTAPITLTSDGRETTHESGCSILESVSYGWLTPLVVKGYKSSLKAADLWQLADSDRAKHVIETFAVQRHSTILRALASMLRWKLLAQFTYSMIALGLKFALPLLMYRILDYIANPSSAPPSVALMNVFGLLLVSLVASIVNNRSDFLSRRMSVRFKAVLTNLLFAKTLRRRTTTKPAKAKLAMDDSDEDATGDLAKDSEKDGAATDAGTITNLLNVDTESIAELSAYLPMFWSTPIQIVIALYYLWHLLGVAILFGMLAIAPSLAFSQWASNWYAKLYKAMMKVSDARLSATNELLQGIRVVKLFAWEPQLREKILGLREAELHQLWQNVKAMFLLGFIGSSLPAMITLFTFGSYTWLLGHKLSAATAFTAISLLDILQSATTGLPRLISWAQKCNVAAQRITTFLGESDIEPTTLPLASEDDADGNTIIGFVDADFSWAEEEAIHIADDDTGSINGQQNAAVPQNGFMLKHLNMRFPTGQLSIVAGPTGCGKTSLLMALLGEMRCTRGHALIPRRSTDEPPTLAGSIVDVAYVAQQAWLQNISIRDNILFGQKYDAARYEQVLHACALERDLNALAAGDRTEIGEKGITLSGGQKQRVALARAVYSTARHLLLDDCLSAVDAHTARHIVEECLRGPLVLGRTCILVTHHVDLCAHDASFIVIMRAGRAVAQGTVKEIVDAGLFSDAFSPNNKTEGADTATTSIDRLCDSEGDASQLQPTQKTSGQLTEEEGHAEGKTDMRNYYLYIRASGGYAYWAFLISVLLASQFVTIAGTNWLRHWVNSYESGGNQPEAARSVGYYLGIYISFNLLALVVFMFGNWLEFCGSIRASRKLFQRLLDRVLHARLRFFDITPVGRLMNRFSKDIEDIDRSLVQMLSLFLMMTSQALGVLAAITFATPEFLLVSMVIVFLFSTVASLYLASSRELKRIESVSKSPLLTLFGETLTGVATIRAFGGEARFISESIERTDDANRPFYLRWTANRWLNWRTDAIGALVSFSAALFIMANRDRMDAGLAGLSLSFALQFVNLSMWTVRAYGAVEMSMNSVERVREYLSIEQESPAIIADRRVAENWPETGEIKVEDLMVQYTPDGKPVVRDLSFAVQPGERVGIVGRTGAGKSTLAVSFFRFVEATSGRIVIDNVDISQIGLHDLRSHLTIIPQDPILFNGTIRSNLDPFNVHDDESIWHALRRSHLIDENGQHTAGLESLDAAVMENGSNFSQGQRQLLAMARALLRNNKLIIMDEATASVDVETDTKIQHTIREEFTGATLLCIAHRLRTIIDYDKVLVMDAGRLVEYDSPYALIQRPTSLFRQLCERSGEFDMLQLLAKAAHTKENGGANSSA